MGNSITEVSECRTCPRCKSSDYLALSFCIGGPKDRVPELTKRLIVCTCGNCQDFVFFEALPGEREECQSAGRFYPSPCKIVTRLDPYGNGKTYTTIEFHDGNDVSGYGPIIQDLPKAKKRVYYEQQAGRARRRPNPSMEVEQTEPTWEEIDRACFPWLDCGYEMEE